MNTERRAALTGLMYGMEEFIPHKDLAAMLGYTVTDVYNELRGMEIDGLVERQMERHRDPMKRYQPEVTWRLKHPA